MKQGSTPTKVTVMSEDMYEVKSCEILFNINDDEEGRESHYLYHLNEYDVWDCSSSVG